MDDELAKLDKEVLTTIVNLKLEEMRPTLILCNVTVTTSELFPTEADALDLAYFEGKLSLEAIRNLQARNVNPSRIDTLDTVRHIFYYDPEAVQLPLSPERYPDAGMAVRLSLPGYDEDGQFAVVFSEVEMGPFAGGGGYYSLKKSGDRWRKKRFVGTWIS